MNSLKKCSLKKHSEVDAVIFCIECNLFMCNKCLNHHNEFIENHHIYNLDKNYDEIFTGLCKEENHKKELNYFCKTHNQLCCAACITKIKGEGNGQHTDCVLCFINDIKNEKKNILNKNIQNLEEFSKTIDNSINKLKQILEKINRDKEELKMQIIKTFTEMKNIINEREDKLLLEIDNKFKELIFKEDNNLFKKIEKYPNIIKNLLERGKKLNEEWDNSKENLNSKINDCIKIENSIKEIKELDENIKKYNSQNIEIKFQKEEDFKDIIEKIKEFGEIVNNEKIYKFNFKNGLNYIVNKNGLIATKNSGGKNWNCTIIGNKEIPKNQKSKWKIKLNETKNYCCIVIGIGPENKNNKNNFYQECWTFYCSTSEKIIKGSQINYNGHSGQLKKGDIVEVIVDRISGSLSFIVNDIDYGVACSEIPKDDILYPVIMLEEQGQIVELI